MSDGIRKYGLGKYATIIDEYVHGLSLDGWVDIETGDVNTGDGWYGFMSCPGHALIEGIIKTYPNNYEPILTPEERKFLASVIGVIINEDSQGFVTVEYFDGTESDELNITTTWKAIEAETNELTDDIIDDIDGESGN